MNQTSQNLFDRLTEELFAFLDDSILSTRQMLEKLTELRAAVIRRDEKSLQWMAEQMPQLTTHRDSMQQRQRQISESFAGPVNCEPGKISLSYLARFLEIPMRNELKTKQKLLAELIGQLSREHLGTELLLRECERLNRMVLDSLVGRGNQTCIYGSAGRIQRDMHCAIMSTRM
jgi:hypothetical protein